MLYLCKLILNFFSLFMKLISWNVNGIRAWHKKGMLDWVKRQDPDFFCVQETKAEQEQLPEELIDFNDYFVYFDHSKERRGHSGVAVYAKYEPDEVIEGLNVKKFDQQGRMLTLIYGNFAVINCYFPNGGGPEERLKFKLEFYEAFLKFVEKLVRDGKEVIFTGDVNVAHTEIDLARPKNNLKSVGFLPEERAWVDKVISKGWIDTFRYLYPKKIDAYTYWDMKSRAKDRNVGWRIDYFFVSKSLEKKIKKAKIHSDVSGSDHCPIELQID